MITTSEMLTVHLLSRLQREPNVGFLKYDVVIRIQHDVTYLAFEGLLLASMGHLVNC